MRTSSILLCSIIFTQWVWSKTIAIENLKSESVNIIRASDYSYAADDTLAIPAGSWAGLRFLDFKGEAGKPVVITNAGGQVIINENTYHGIHLSNCQFIHLTGTGSPNHNFGFDVQKAAPEKSGMGVVVGYLSSDVEVDHIKIANTGFAGIMAKTDPTCTDSLTWRRNGYVLRNLHIHHNKITDTHGEGMYIGYTGSYKTTSKVQCNGEYVMGHWLENVLVENNWLERTGWDGIQLSLVRKNGIIRQNTVLEYGLQEEPVQNFGMSIGSGIYDIYNNYIRNGESSQGVGALGMQLINGESGSRIIGNIFIRPGEHGVFIHNRSTFENKNKGYVVAHNTVIEPAKSGIFYNSTITTSLDTNEIGDQQLDVPFYLVNNLVVNPGNDYTTQNFWKKDLEAYYDFNTRDMRDSHMGTMYNNAHTRKIDSVGFVDPSNNDFRLSALSVLINQGFAADSFNIPDDIWGEKRGADGGFDIGASEYTATPSAVGKNALSLSQVSQQIKQLTFNDFVVFNINQPGFAWQVYTPKGLPTSLGQMQNTPGVYFARGVKKDQVVWFKVVGE